jgi:dolichol-phosphate mannosyltransferase
MKLSPTPQSPPNAPAATVQLSIVIPCYLEAESLRTLLPAIQASAAALTPAFEILIIDTQHPMDDTASLCQLHGVRHLHRSGGNQYGDAVRTGIRAARGQYILSMDADGSHDPRFFPALWAQRERFDIVIGSRYMAGGHTENPAILIWMSYVVNLTFRLVFRIHAKDVTNSLRLYHADLLRPLTLESGDFDILEEILIKAITKNPSLRIREVPITFGRRKAGESKRKLVQFAFGFLKTLQKLRKFQQAARREAQTASHQSQTAGREIQTAHSKTETK